MKKSKLMMLILASSLLFSGCQSDDTDSSSSHKRNKDNDVSSENDTNDEDNDDIENNETNNDIASDNQGDDTDMDSDDNTDEDDGSSDDENSDDDENEENDYELSENHDAIVDLSLQKSEMLEYDNGIYKCDEIYELNKQIASLNTYDFSDTTITFLGDSITYGRGGNTNEYSNLVSYVDYVRDILDCKTNNISSPGAPIGSFNGYDALMYKVSEIPEDTDIIVIFGGINDYIMGAGYFGDESCTPGTFTGDIETMCSEIRERFPDKPVYMVMVYKGRYESDSNIKNALSIDEYMRFERQMARKYDFNMIDFYSYNLLNNQDSSIFSTYFSDTIHPNDTGYMWIGRYVAAEIVEDFN